MNPSYIISVEIRLSRGMSLLRRFFSLAKLFDDSYRFMVLSSINSEQYKMRGQKDLSMRYLTAKNIS